MDVCLNLYRDKVRHKGHLWTEQCIHSETEGGTIESESRGDSLCLVPLYRGVCGIYENYLWSLSEISKRT